MPGLHGHRHDADAEREAVSERAPSLQRQPSSADPREPPPGSWCSCWYSRWWTEREPGNGSGGWRCMTCHPPDHLPAEAVRVSGL